MHGWFLIIGGCLVLMLTGLSFFVGVAFGVSANYLQFSALYLPLLSTAGNWVAGIGAFGAVATSLWLADRQRREDVQSLVITLKHAFVGALHLEGPFLSIDIVSEGRRPATVTGVAILSKHASTKLQIVQFHHASDRFPASLQYGDSLGLLCLRDFHIEISSFLDRFCGGRTDGLELSVSTTLRRFKVPIEASVLEGLKVELDGL